LVIPWLLTDANGRCCLGVDDRNDLGNLTNSGHSLCFRAVEALGVGEELLLRYRRYMRIEGGVTGKTQGQNRH